MAEARAGGMPAIGKVRSSMGALESSTEDTTRVLILYLAIPSFVEYDKKQLLLSVFLEELKTGTQKRHLFPIFILAFLTIAR